MPNGQPVMRELERVVMLLSLIHIYAKTSGQLRTRFQAFVESLEIKRIQQGKEVK